jgi:hypothetical protein
MNFDNLYQGVNPDVVIWYGQAYQALLQLTIENIENNSSVFHSSVCGEHHRFLRKEKAYRCIYSGSTTPGDFSGERINRGLSRQD